MKNKLTRLCLAAILSALAIVLVTYIHVSIIPVVSFLEYDPADIPIYLGTILLGPAYGLGMTVATSVIQGVTVSAGSGWIGIVMHILATGAASLTLGLWTRKSKSNRRVIAGLSGGSLVMVVTMFLWNCLFTPIFMNTTLEVVLKLMPYIVLFNIIKAVSNSVLAFALYKALQPALARLKLWER